MRELDLNDQVRRSRFKIGLCLDVSFQNRVEQSDYRLADIKGTVGLESSSWRRDGDMSVIPSRQSPAT